MQLHASEELTESGRHRERVLERFYEMRRNGVSREGEAKGVLVGRELHRTVVTVLTSHGMPCRWIDLAP